MESRRYCRETDLDAVLRIYDEIGWMGEGEEQQKGHELFVEAGRTHVALVRGETECLVVHLDATLRHLTLPYSWRRAAPHGILSRIERVGRFQDVCLLASRVVGEAAWVRARSAQESTLDGSATSSDAAIARDGRPQSCEPMNKAGSPRICP